jgi:hypothetical protein
MTDQDPRDLEEMQEAAWTIVWDAARESKSFWEFMETMRPFGFFLFRNAVVSECRYGRYKVGGEQCGAPVKEGSWYCEKHDTFLANLSEAVASVSQGCPIGKEIGERCGKPLAEGSKFCEKCTAQGEQLWAWMQSMKTAPRDIVDGGSDVG